MSLKKVLPFEKYTLTTKLPLEEILKRISYNVEPNKSTFYRFFSSSSMKPYQGIVENDSFTIKRILSRWKRDTFVPIISGQITSFFGATQIKINMRLRYFVLFFMLVWLGLVGSAVVIGLIQSRDILQNGPSAFLVIPVTMFLFGCLLFTLPFKIESKNSKEFLSKLFEAQETDYWI